MSNSIPLTDLKSSPAAKFTNFGDSVQGRIAKIEKRDQTDLDGNVVTFQDGTPRPQWVISVEQADGSTVALYARGGSYEVVEGEGTSMLDAITSAAAKAGAKSLDAGAKLAVAYTGRGKPTKVGRDAPRLYRAVYELPTQSVPLEGMFSQ